MVLGTVRGLSVGKAKTPAETFNDRLRALYGRQESNELPSKEYFRNYLRFEDANGLEVLVNALGEGLGKDGMQAAIIAVGSSTYAHDYWGIIRDINTHFDTRERTTYRDIDLRVLPVERATIAVVDNLKALVGRALENAGYSAEFRPNTSLGGSLLIGDRGVVPWEDFGYGISSFSTKLAYGTLVDVILGTFPRLALTAEEAIANERGRNRPFSLLYAPGHKVIN